MNLFLCICIYVAGNESCPQPQTSEHLAAIEIMKLKHILILQNKIDLVKEGQAKEQHEQILKFVQGTVAEGAPIIPISAQLKYNIEVSFLKLFSHYFAFMCFLIYRNFRYCVNTSRKRSLYLCVISLPLLE